MNWEDGIRQINDCEYLFLRRVGEIEELTLGLVVAEAKLREPTHVPKDDSLLGKLLAGANPIEEDSTCRVFEVVFHQSQMVSYSVLNESYGIYPKPPEHFTGKLFRTFSWSHLLEFTKQTTIACDDYPGVLRHYEIACLNHVVDVISTGPPRISVGLFG